jgi:hypothetical protein
MAEPTKEELRRHIERWRGTARRKGPGFNAGPIDQLREEMRWLCERIDERGAEQRKSADG